MTEATEGRRPVKSSLSGQLSLWSRAAALTLGLAGVGSGAAATFLSEAEAGPVALIATGALCLVVGLSGALPSKFRFGDNEVEWQREVGEIIAGMVDRTPSDRAHVLDSVGDLIEAAPAVGAPVLVALSRYDEAVSLRCFVIESLPENIFLLTPKDIRRLDRPLLIGDPIGRRLAVQSLSNDDLDSTTERQAVEAALYSLAGSMDRDEADGALLITTSDLSEPARSLKENSHVDYAVANDGGYDPASLYIADAVDAAFGSVPGALDMPRSKAQYDTTVLPT